MLNDRSLLLTLARELVAPGARALATPGTVAPDSGTPGIAAPGATDETGPA
jgi:hypothetical protein